MADEHEHEPADREHSVTVHDEDDGSIFHLAGRPEELVEGVVDALYRDHLHRDRRPGDRLRCDDNGDDVFSNLGQSLKEYRMTHCHDLVWNFIGDQGGALA